VLFFLWCCREKTEKKEVWPIPRLGEKTLTHIKEKQKKKLEGNNVHRIELLPCYYYHFSSVTIQNGPLVDKLKVSGSEYKRRAPENVTKAAGRKKRKKNRDSRKKRSENYGYGCDLLLVVYGTKKK
jgi:hypothetical protein